MDDASDPRYCWTMPTADDYRARISRALEYAREHLDENPGLSAMAAAAAFSPYHFHRIFSAATGETPAEHVKRLRLEKAANLLRYRPAAPVGDIALDCGFSTASAFSRDFKARFGRTPHAYRAKPSGGSARRRADAPPLGRETSGCRIETVGPLRIAYCSGFGPYGSGAGKAWSALMRWAVPRGLAGRGARIYGISWDNPDVTEDGRLRYDACIEIPPETAGCDAVSIREIPALRCLTLHFAGPERLLQRAYARLYYSLLPDSGCDPADFPAFERYLSMPKGFFNRRFDAVIHLPLRP